MNDASPRQKCLALVRAMAEVSKPDDEAHRVLALLAAMANHSWVDGDLVVKLIGDSELAVLELLVDDGFSAERILGPVCFNAPLGEFAAEVQVRGRQLAPLALAEPLSDRRVVLRGRPAYAREHRAASLSAFDTALLKGMSGHPASGPEPEPPPALASEPPAFGSYDRPLAVLEMPTEYSADRRAEPEPPAASPRKGPPPPPRRKPR